MTVAVEHPTAGRLRMLGRPIKFPGEQQPPLEPPPILGQHTEAILRQELGLSEERVDALRTLGAIGTAGTG